MGQGTAARTDISKINYVRLPRNLRVKVASLAYRADLPELCVHILHPVLFPARGTPSSATEPEKAEYAMGLIYMGAVQEGMQILTGLNPEPNPKIYFNLALGYIAQW